jgi:hypothetical protein
MPPVFTDCGCSRIRPSRVAEMSATIVKGTATPWISRDRMPLKRLPDNTDFLEQIYAASEVTGYKEDIAVKTKTQ